MQTRVNIAEVLPEGYKAMLNFSRAIDATSLTKIHKELIKIRASQINGCAFCLIMHTTDARKYGESEQRIYALNAWRETPYFDEAERAILALTEEVTHISSHVSDATYSEAVSVLGEQYTAEVILAAVVINSWNRIAISTNMPPAPLQVE